MSTQFFGHFLLAQGAVTPAQLDEAILFQRSRNQRMGDLAVARGWLTAIQAEAVNAAQRRLDQRFGALAREMGLLNEVQVSELLQVQRSEHMHLGEALVILGLVGDREMSLLLPDFERQRVRFGTEIERFLARVAHGELVMPTIDLGIKLFARIAHIPALIHGCAIGGVRWPPHPYAISQQFTGQRLGRVTLTLTEPLLVHVAGKMAGEVLSADDPMCLEAAAEFLNTLSGNLLARLTKAHYDLDLEPPMRAPAFADDRAVVTTLATPVGEASLMVCVEG
ncbi:MAG: chemotaxis protein CheX [Candidatus Sericytochromatia bacterium]|nr:chemotaxis protein CheX [Candidatus Sericytochromatia bacterium]